MNIYSPKRDLKVKGFCIFLFVFCILNYAHGEGEGYELPLYNPDLMTFFSSELRYFQSVARTTAIDYGGYTGYRIQIGSGGWFTDSDGQRVLQALVGFLYPINDYFCIPIHFSALSYSPTLGYFPVTWPIDPSYVEMFTGSGLIIHTKWLTLGGYIGYHSLTLYDETLYDNDQIQYFRAITSWPRFNLPVLSRTRGINYAIVPAIETDFWYLQKIEGYFSTGKFEPWAVSDNKNSFSFSDVSMYTRLLFNGFNLFNQDNNSFAPYYSKSNYDWKTRNDVYGIRVGIDKINLDGGYRVFDSNYSNTWFAAASYNFEIIYISMFDTDKTFVILAFDSYNKKLGLGFNEYLGGNGTLLLELVLNKNNSFSMSMSMRADLYRPRRRLGLY